MSRSDYRGSNFIGNWTGSQYPAPFVFGPPLPGLAAWFKADAGITLNGGNVSRWADQSGNGNDVIQLTSANRPVFTASAINGLPGVTFNDVNHLLTAPSSPLPAGSARHIITVSKPTTSPGGSDFSWGGTQVQFHRYDSGSAFIMYVGKATVSGLTFGYSDAVSNYNITSPPDLQDVPSICEMSGAGLGGAITFVANGTTYALSAPDTQSDETGSDLFVIGNNFGSNVGPEVASGPICEVLIYDHVLSTVDLAQVRAYIASRYGIA